MRIAVIGSGISGMVAAHRLSADHDVTVFEAASYVGGHTHTVDIEHDGARHAIDTGFIVFNDWTYPNFIALLDELEVAWQPSDMSFSVSCERSGLEYNGTSLNTLFAQRLNLVRPSFLRMVTDILRFNRHAPTLLEPGAAALTLAQYLESERYSRHFIDHYIMPMGAAVWSARPRDMLDMPARFLIEFFANHGFLNVSNRPVWRVIKGGSRGYIAKLTAAYASKIRLDTPVESILRQPHKVTLRLRNGGLETFDAVFLACHSDQALRLLADPSHAEEDILGAIKYQENEVILHTDQSLMPHSRRAWAAWNYHLPQQPVERVTVTYNMNILQSLPGPAQFMVTLNPVRPIESGTVLGRYLYDHPVFTTAAVAAQHRRNEISGVNNTYYCGAYWTYGFHEDGVNSALVAVQELRRREAHAEPHLQRVG
jgi:predicted NAD/FAD-binding protein